MATVDDDAPEERKRIQGLRWTVTQEFLDALNALLDTKGVTSGSVARELSLLMGQEVEESGIRALRKATAGSRGSALVGPLCRLKGWPVPPLADAESELAVDFAGLYELDAADPMAIAAIREAIRDRLASLRKIRNLNKK
jgi:hypothetical protein